MEKCFDNNNLFQFATSELSQDAIICWICNNYNYGMHNRSLYELADLVIHQFLGDEEIKIVSDVKIHQQFHKIDVLIIVNDMYGIIIEDKTYTSEHGNQLQRYKQELIELSDEERAAYKLPKFNEENIRTVYLKTGFFYPYDEAVKADVKISGWDWYDILSKYEGESQILDDYVIKLNKDLEWYSNIKKSFLLGKVEDVLNTYYGQYLLIHEMFAPLDSFSHGSSRGRVWSNHNMVTIPYSYLHEEETKVGHCTLFCRIDRKGVNYYASVRQYDRSLEKTNCDMVQKKKDMFYTLRDIFTDVCISIDELGGAQSSKYMVGGNNGGYYESEFGVFFLGETAEQIDIKEFPSLFRKFNKRFRTKLNDCLTLNE